MRVELPTYSCLKSLPGSLFGAAPSKWRPIRLKFVMPEVTVGIVITPSKYYVDDGVPAIRSLNVKDGRLTDDDLVFFSEEDNRKLAKTRIYKGDIVIVRTGQTGACAVVDERFNGANCIDLIIVRKSRHLRSKFLQYFLSSREAAAEITVSSNGAIQQHFNIGLVREISLLQPRLEEQDAILSFIDRETAKIDRLMKVRRKQVERLQEQRTAVIHHAVTKGLDPHAELKSSGVEWLGDVNSDWSSYHIKHLAEVVAGGTPKSSDYDLWDGDVVWLTPTDLGKDGARCIKASARTITALGQAAAGLSLLPIGSLVMSTRAPVGSMGILGVPATTNQGCKAMVFDERNADSRFFYYLLSLSIPFLNAAAQGATFVELSGFQLKNLKISCPDVETQRQIADYLDDEMERFDALFTRFHRELELLAEYRASLISHAVTGKIDVRDLVAPAQPEGAAII
jgi:type I restriction enzyme, S subunit